MVDKPQKPYADFPLFPHDSGQWAKKIAGHTRYFGPWKDWRRALAKYLGHRDELHLDKPVGLLLPDLCEAFIVDAEARRDRGSLSRPACRRYDAACRRMVEVLGDVDVAAITPADFARLRSSLAEHFCQSSLTVQIALTKAVFRWAWEHNLLKTPVRYGAGFSKPTAGELRRHRAARGPRTLPAATIRAALDKATPQLQAAILLAVNCGYGPGDLVALELAHLDLARGWATMPRVKTGVPRACPLWPETVAAVKAYAGRRTTGRLLLSRTGRGFTAAGWISQQFGRLVDHPSGLSLYALRHVVETIGGESGDQVAVDSIMGHADASMAASYRHGVGEVRLRAVVERVRTWLWPPTP